MTALRQFLGERKDFEIARELSDKAMITQGIDGYLQRIAGYLADLRPIRAVPQ